MSNHTPGTASPATTEASVDALLANFQRACEIALDTGTHRYSAVAAATKERAILRNELRARLLRPSPASETATIAQETLVRFSPPGENQHNSTGEMRPAEVVRGLGGEDFVKPDGYSYHALGSHTRAALRAAADALDAARSSSEPSVTTDAETGGVVSRRQFDALRERTAKLLCGLNDEINRLEAELRDLRSARTPESSPAVDDETVSRDWTEDFAHENGRYLNNCLSCGREFTGHKRRFVCKRCAARRSPESVPRSDAERLEAMATADWTEVAEIRRALSRSGEGDVLVLRRAIDHVIDGTRPWDEEPAPSRSSSATSPETTQENPNHG